MSIYVVFFGGYQSSRHDMHVWKASASRQRPDVQFDTFPYPSQGSSAIAAVKGFDAKFNELIKKIGNVGDDTTLFIVGHSSGCAIANELNSRLQGSPAKTTLVCLDGFRPREDQKQKSDIQLWCAEQIGGRGISVNWAADRTPYKALHATQQWSLHFSMVNTAATDAITRDTYPWYGYARCAANLCWLPKDA